jgi:undecaprenyl-diphosphatase
VGIIEAIIMGIIQGLTEFLPVSSSGHLELAKAILGDESIPKERLLFTVVVHAATALATVAVYRAEVWHILKGLLAFKNNEEFKYSLKIVISMIPAAFVGVFFDDLIEIFFDGRVAFVGSMLLLTAVLLFVGDRSRKGTRHVSYADSIVIGIAQAIAILPGISRSGATIATSVMLGVDREKAARFSFLMVVPLILGKMAKDILGGDLSSAETSAGVLAAGFVAAFVFGFAACTWMIAIVKRAKLVWFAIYCAVAGAVAIFVGF